MKIKASQQHQFSVVSDARIERSAFNRSHNHKSTFSEGDIIPILVDEVLPGDTFKVKMTAFCRIATMLKPLMDNLYLDVFYFAVPFRLVWSNWAKFNGEQTNPGDSTAYTIPSMSSIPGYNSGSIHDYLGLPIGVTITGHSALYHRAYNLIYNQWFRDENLINSAYINTSDTGDAPGDYYIRKRAKRHDYFTSCLPWPQKGTAVTLPLGITAPVRGNGQNVYINNTLESKFLTGTSGDNFARTNSPWTGTGNLRMGQIGTPADTGLVADLSSATAATINQLREAFQIQRMYERDARGGTRYIEIIRSHFGVTSPDFRLQRPEYLGGGTTPIMINQVAQTGTGGTPLANLAAFGSVVSQNGFVKSFTEHCILMGLVSVRSDVTYQQGMDRMFNRNTRFDFYWPSLSHLGEEPILSKEIYYDGSAGDTNVFGYNERYASYRYKPSRVSGLFRSQTGSGFDIWHLAQNFGSRPVLGQTFIEEAAPMARIKATVGDPDFIFDSHFDMNCVRPMPVYSVPGHIDHF